MFYGLPLTLQDILFSHFFMGTIFYDDHILISLESPPVFLNLMAITIKMTEFHKISRYLLSKLKNAPEWLQF